MAGAGDVNGDGDDDVLIGAPYVGYNPSLAEHAPGARNISRTDSGASYVVFGSDSPTDIDLADLGPAGFCIDGATGDFSGRAVAGLGDVNGDDLDDLLIGAPEAGNNDRDSSGSSYVVFGSEESPDVDLADLGNGGFRIDGTAASDNSGSAVAGAGDVNDDGSNDLLIGAPYAGNNDRDDSGSSYLLLGTYTTPGAPTGVSGTPGDAQVQLSWTAPAFDGGAHQRLPDRDQDQRHALDHSHRQHRNQRDQPHRHRADQRHHVPVPGRRHQPRRHRAGLRTQ